MVSPSGLPAPGAHRLSVCVATYNGRSLLERMLPTLAAQSYRDFGVIVVDDASSDDTVAWLKRSWPEVRVVALEVNGGVTAAFNECLRATAGSPVVALFNNDMELAPECLGELVRALDAHPNAGSAGAKLMDANRSGVLDGAGDVFDLAGTGWRRGHGQRDDGRYDRAEPVFGACGGAAAYRREALEQVGLFDEAFHAFVEDTDWALRAQLAGWECRYVPTAVALHLGSATLGKGLTDFTRYRLVRNRIWMIVKAYPLGLAARHAHRIAYVSIAELALAIRDRRFGVWRRAVTDAVRGLPAAVQKRRRVQATRSVSVPELETALRAGSQKAIR